MVFLDLHHLDHLIKIKPCHPKHIMPRQIVTFILRLELVNTITNQSILKTPKSY